MSTVDENQPSTPGRSLKVWPTCTGLKKNGEPCKGPGTIPTPEGPRCPHHSDRYGPEEKSSWGQRGALATNHAAVVKKFSALADSTDLDVPDLSTTGAVEAFLARTIAETRMGKLPPSLARTINELIQTRLKLVELDQQKLLLDLEAELRDEP